MKKSFYLLIVSVLFLFASCGSGKQPDTNSETDSTKTEVSDSITTDTIVADSSDDPLGLSNNGVSIAEGPRVTIQFFHATHRCPTCIAIGDCVNAVLKESFGAETRSGSVKLTEIDADDDANKAICEKYEAFGTALFITRNYKGKESITDLTAPAFKMAQNKKTEFEKMIKDQIVKDLKQ
ncbi:MAG: hypothetical protein CVU11_08135 [Bacteroidetes bacterium HGW-Bacteroidetes-6]|jgi:hypothetical protein|nr:MAG: hypothetical protein CVU11_08135 [Bacteroidetes bacterium HGW-Bacteroidetes-6]